MSHLSHRHGRRGGVGARGVLLVERVEAVGARAEELHLRHHVGGVDLLLALLVAWRVVAARRRRTAHEREIAAAVAAARADAGSIDAEREPVPAGAASDSSATAADETVGSTGVPTRASRRSP